VKEDDVQRPDIKIKAEFDTTAAVLELQASVQEINRKMSDIGFRFFVHHAEILELRQAVKKMNPKKQCRACGKEKHARKLCPARRILCENCDRYGHLSQCCWSKPKAGNAHIDLQASPRENSAKFNTSEHKEHRTTAEPADDDAQSEVSPDNNFD